MMKYSALIVDDNRKSINLLTYFIKEFLPSLNVIGKAYSVESGIVAITNLQPQIVFLDILLHDKNAFDLLDNIDFSRTEIIFVTAYDIYALKAFKYNAIDYILKPILVDDLIAAVEKCVQRIEEKKIFKDNSINESEMKNESNPYLSIICEDEIKLIKKEEIIYCKSTSDKTIFYLINDEKYITSKSIGDFEILLEKDYFFRIHHSYIANLQHLINISEKDGYSCKLINGITLPIAKRRQGSLRVFLKLKKNLDVIF